MRQKFFLQPFAFAGDQTPINDALQPSGVVSFNQGWGFDYQRDQSSDPLAKPIDRMEMNYLMATITENLQQYQQRGFPEFITPDNNNLVPFSYARGTIVLWSADGNDPLSAYVSMVDNNQTDPSNTDNWQEIDFPALIAQSVGSGGGSGIPAGFVGWFAAQTPPDGFLICDGAVLSRTVYANLFAAIGVTFGVGDSVSTFSLPDLRGEFIRGFDAGRAADANRVFGSAQANALGSHSHSFYASKNGGSSGSTLQSTAYWNGNYLEYTNNAGADETRPRNVALLPCIKF